MLSRRYRLVTTAAIAIALFLLFTRHYQYGYRELALPDLRIPDGWLHKDDHGAIGHDDRKPGSSPGRPEDVVSSVEEPTPAQDAQEPLPPGHNSKTAQQPSVVPAADEKSQPAGKISPGEPDTIPNAPPYPRPYKAADEDVDWSRFAYTQYVTNSEYLCNSVMMFEALNRLGAQADRVMLYPVEMMPDPLTKSSDEWDARLIIMARDKFHVKVIPINIQHRDGMEETWADSFTKLLAFNQTQYDRVLNLDSDGVVLGPMDELFLTPQCTVAMPRAYWLLHDDPPRRVLSSQLMLVTPSSQEFERVKAHIDKAGENDYDMEIVNQLYLDSAMILPHRKYDLLTAEYRSKNHAFYLGSDKEKWDPLKVLNEAKFVHFSDWPIPKPWIPMEDEQRLEMQPECHGDTEKPDCTDREIWNGFYNDYMKQRQKICFEESWGTWQ